MKSQLPDKLEDGRIAGPFGTRSGFFIIKHGSAKLRLQISDGGGWDHVSVSLNTRCPTWDEMCYVKSLLFEAHEAVMQLHPPASDYRNFHAFCLHLWRPQTAGEIAVIRADWGNEWPYGELPVQGEIPLPPGEFVAPENTVKGRQLVGPVR